jgi:hypothetical protein
MITNWQKLQTWYFVPLLELIIRNILRNGKMANRRCTLYFGKNINYSLSNRFCRHSYVVQNVKLNVPSEYRALPRSNVSIFLTRWSTYGVERVLNMYICSRSTVASHFIEVFTSTYFKIFSVFLTLCKKYCYTRSFLVCMSFSVSFTSASLFSSFRILRL